MNKNRLALPAFAAVLIMACAFFALGAFIAPSNSCAQVRDSSIPDATGVTGGNAGGGSGTIASQTCDTEVWKTMEARARIETEREIMQNQNLIFKPDSVLSYVCFDKFAGHASENIGVLFTHTTYWNSTEIIKWGAPNGMDNAMQKVVIASLTPYIQGNFNHAYLGGRGTWVGLGGKAPTPSMSGKGGTYSCGEMAKVWAVAKCMNFIHTNNFKNDGFFPFADLTAQSGGQSVAGYQSIKEVRSYPNPCSGEPIAGSSWQDAFRASRNENSFGDPNKEYKFGEPLQQNFKDVREKIAPASEKQCGAPVKTGITVILGSGDTKTHEDGVCTNPGCVLTNYGTCSTNAQSQGSARPGESGI